MDGAAQPFIQVRVPYVLDQNRNQEAAGSCAYDNLQPGGSERRKRQSRSGQNAGELYVENDYQQYNDPMGSLDNPEVLIQCSKKHSCVWPFSTNFSSQIF